MKLLQLLMAVLGLFGKGRDSPLKRGGGGRMQHYDTRGRYK